MTLCGIYCIKNLINEKIYIGYSRDILNRWKQHCRKSRRNDSNTYLYNAMNYYGLENFSLQILEICKEGELQKKEKYWIDKLNSNNRNIGYNMTAGGDGNYTIGEENNNAKLSREDVIFIREGYRDGNSKIEFYRDHFIDKISWPQFSNIWMGKQWVHIMPEVYTRERKEDNIHRSLKGRVNVGSSNGMSKLTEFNVKAIIDRLKFSNDSQKQIAIDFNVHYNCINGINCCKYWTHLHSYKHNIRKEHKEGCVCQ